MSREAALENSPARKRWVSVFIYITAPEGRQIGACASVAASRLCVGD